MHNAIVALILHCLNSRLMAVLGSTTQSALEAKSGAGHHSDEPSQA